jgi:hypothetical protein
VGTQSVPKDDLSNVYAYGTHDADGHLVLYAGLERLSPNGASHIDIEFNREQIALDEAPPCDNEPCGFLGNKTVGDILVAMEFTPTTSPAMFTSGPPLFPGFTAASVWMNSNPGPATPGRRGFLLIQPHGVGSLASWCFPAVEQQNRTRGPAGHSRP